MNSKYVESSTVLFKSMALTISLLEEFLQSLARDRTTLRFFNDKLDLQTSLYDILSRLRMSQHSLGDTFSRLGEKLDPGVKPTSLSDSARSLATLIERDEILGSSPALQNTTQTSSPKPTSGMSSTEFLEAWMMTELEKAGLLYDDD